MIELKDQMNRTIRLGAYPKRIVSLVPSQTELLYYLDCHDEVVGITKFCIHPDAWFRNKARVGGTKNVNFEKLAALKPDLIIANKEENAQADIEALCKKYPVYISDIFNVEDACQMVHDVGVLTNREDKASDMILQVKRDFDQLPKLNGRVLYFIWNKPYMVAGPKTFIGFLIEKLGFENVISDSEVRYIELSEEEIIQLNPDHLLLSSEPFPFTEKHIPPFKAFYPNGKYHLVDGELFSWYGSRMLEMKSYFEKIGKDFS